MAYLNRLNALFKVGAIKQIVNRFSEDFNEKTHQTLLYMGEQFINKARVNGNYTDRTGNLRASIGYIILNDGRILNEVFEGDKQEGATQGQKIANEIAQQYTRGFILIGVAGMNYAASVEVKGYDVISGSAPESGELKSILRDTFIIK